MMKMHFKYIFIYFILLPILFLSKPDLQNPDILTIGGGSSSISTGISSSRFDDIVKNRECKIIDIHGYYQNLPIYNQLII